jgi:dTDP-4-dehydrorhamnose reductase
MKIILTGASGLIGSRFEKLLFENHELIPLSSGDGIDITDKSSIENFLSNKSADAIIHLAGKTDVDSCEEDKKIDLGILNIEKDNAKSFEPENTDINVWKNEKTAFAINTIGTKNLYDVAKEKGMKFVYISTDFVFPGNGEYNEDSQTAPINWYGMTKWYGERLIDVSKDLIVRLSFPYGYQSPVRQDFVWKIIDLLKEKTEVSLISDQTITPTFIDDIVNGLDFLILKNASGIYHLTGSSYETPYQIGHKIKHLFGFGTKISDVALEELYKDKAQRPFQSKMQNVKIKQLGFMPKTFDEGLEAIKIM